MDSNRKVGGRVMTRHDFDMGIEKDGASRAQNVQDVPFGQVGVGSCPNDAGESRINRPAWRRGLDGVAPVRRGPAPPSLLLMRPPGAYATTWVLNTPMG